MRAWILAISSGILLGLSQPLVIEWISDKPLDSTGLLASLVFVGYVPFFWALQDSSPKRAFGLTLIIGTVQYWITLYWIMIPLTVFGGIPTSVGLLITTLLCLILATYAAIGVACARFVSIRLKWPSWIPLLMGLCAMDYVRNYLPCGGFPWGSVGYSFTALPVLLQSASWIGVYGLVFYILLVNAAVFSIIRDGVAQLFSVKRPVLWAVICTLMVLACGVWILEQAKEPISPSESISVALLQGNIEQGIKNKQYLMPNRVLGRYHQLEAEGLASGAQLIVWPEAALPLFVPNSRKRLSGMDNGQVTQVVGAVGLEQGEMTNSAFFVSPTGEVMGRADKSHLVPFGEYVPWPFVHWVSRVVPGLGQGFRAGQGFEPIELKLHDGRSVSIGTTICYEGIFPEISRGFVRNGAELLVNLTNDAWYGVSSAPYQHLAMYQMRSVETGRYFARSTNTGVSAFVDPQGRIHSPSALYEQGVVVGTVQMAHGLTPYVLLGDIIPQLCVLVMMLSMLLGSWKSYANRK